MANKDIKKITEDLLGLLGFEEFKVEQKYADGRIKIEIRLPNAKTLIGERGATLSMFQHIVRRMAAKTDAGQALDPLEAGLIGSGDFLASPKAPWSQGRFFVQIDIDINGYKRMREDVLRDFAMDIADTVKTKRTIIELDPMPASDRRIIHLTLSKIPQLETESVGEGLNRYVIVRPVL